MKISISFFVLGVLAACASTTSQQQEVNPSSENIAMYIAQQLDAGLTEEPASVSRVTVWESENASATFVP